MQINEIIVLKRTNSWITSRIPENYRVGDRKKYMEMVFGKGSRVGKQKQDICLT